MLRLTTAMNRTPTSANGGVDGCLTVFYPRSSRTAMETASATSQASSAGWTILGVGWRRSGFLLFESPQRILVDDVSNYYQAVPEYGDSLLIDSLIREVHKGHAKVVFDMVLNHTSDQHPWFQESRSYRTTPQRLVHLARRARQSRPTTGSTPHLSCLEFTSGPSRTTLILLHFQPDLNGSNPEVKSAMFDMMRYWLDRGVDGFRLDIFNFCLRGRANAGQPTDIKVHSEGISPKSKLTEQDIQCKPSRQFCAGTELRGLCSMPTTALPRFLVGEVFGNHCTLRAIPGRQPDTSISSFFLTLRIFD